MWWWNRITVRITLPTPEGEVANAAWRSRRYAVSISVPNDMEVSPVFLTGIYEDLSAHAGIQRAAKKQPQRAI